MAAAAVGAGAGTGAGAGAGGVVAMQPSPYLQLRGSESAPGTGRRGSGTERSKGSGAV
jgi:hypothetical protein